MPLDMPVMTSPRPLIRRRDARVATVLLTAVVLICAAPVHPASLPPARCEASKLKAAGSAALRVLKCYADAARAGSGVDPTCVSGVTNHMASAFTRAEANVCTSTGEVSVVSTALMALADDLSAMVGSGPSLCDSRKLLAAAKRAQASLKAQALHGMAPERDRLTTALSKAGLKFSTRIAAAESAGGCTSTGNTIAIGARADTGSSDAVDAVRGTLQSLATRSGRVVGTAVRANLLASNESAYRDTILRQFNTLTAEYEFMWGNMEPTRGGYIYGPIDTIVAFAQQHGLPLKGAPLVWHLILPPWVNDDMTPAELQTAVDERIDTLMGAYAGKVATWDVVNEAVVDFGASFRSSIFLQKLGPDYIRDAFIRARQADPNALLFYNDFLADGMNLKSDFIYDMVVGLLAQGTPIDGVGFQMHLGGGFGPAPTGESVRQNLQRFADLGLIVRVSEMDVETRYIPPSNGSRLAAQRAIYHDVVAACLSVARCDSVTFWGFTDKYTWVKDYLGITDPPLPFDDGYQPKAAFFGVRDALRGF